MTYVCYQGNDHDCGFAALKMLMANRCKNKSYLYIKKPSKKRSYTFQDLIRLARSYGFVLSSFYMPPEDVKSISSCSLVQLKNNHAVYIIKVGKKRITYFDPGEGKICVSHSEFAKIFSGYLIECTNSKDAREVDSKKPRMLSPWMDALHYVIIAVIFGMLMAGIYLIQDNSSIIITMLFLLGFAIAELVENWYILKELKYFDNKYLSIFFSRSFNQNMDGYRFYTEYKSKYFIVSKLLLSSMIMITAFSVLLCLNDYRNVFAFLILLLIRMLDSILLSKKERKDIKTIDGIEATMFDSKTTLMRSLQRANDLSGRVALGLSLKKIAYLFISLCLSLGMMIVTGIVSTNFIIFHFGIYFLMSESMGNVVSFFSNSTDRKLKRARFLDLCDL